jgi:hypothetical protein
MSTRLFSLVTLLAVSTGGGALAQAALAPAVAETTAAIDAAKAVGKWLYDSQGKKIGSVRSLSADGRTASIMVGSYTQQGSHEARIPASALSMVNGKVKLRAGTVEALNTASRQ